MGRDDAPGRLGRRALYGRFRGKALRPHQARLIAELLPELEIDAAALAEPQRLFAFAPREIRLEIGFGGGEHLAARAKEAPDVGFLGCEPFVNGVAKLLAVIEAEGLANIRIRMGDARVLVEALPDASLSTIYALYPDPWPKRRQNKRRLMNVEMIAQFARVLKPEGELRFATDIDDYAGWTLSRLCGSSAFHWRARRADDWRQPWPGWRPTRYEAKARAEGRGSAYLSFVRASSLTIDRASGLATAKVVRS